MQTKIIILSTDIVIKSFLAGELAKSGHSAIVQIHNPSELPLHLTRPAINVLILDTDTVTVPPDNARALSSSQGVQIILLGIKNAAPLMLVGIRGAISKPDITSNFAKRVFAGNINDRIASFVRTYTPTRIGDTSSAADINGAVIAFAASTGGTDALDTVLRGLPAEVPPILIVQHMPSVFTTQFADRLDKSSKFTVKEASLNDVAKRNLALLAPGDLHMKVVNRGKKLLIECFHGDKVHGVRPAADVLFNSMAEHMGRNVIGVILTGMGADGARGMLQLKRKGAIVIAQNRETCVVYGMPKSAVDLGIVDYELPIDKIAEKIRNFL